jgi:hypothetical protein
MFAQRHSGQFGSLKQFRCSYIDVRNIDTVGFESFICCLSLLEVFEIHKTI